MPRFAGWGKRLLERFFPRWSDGAYFHERADAGTISADSYSADTSASHSAGRYASRNRSYDRRRARVGSGRRDDPGGDAKTGHRYADALLSRDTRSSERMPRLCSGTGRGAHSCPGLLAKSRSGHGDSHGIRTRATKPQAVAGISGFLGGRFNRAGVATVPEAVWRETGTIRYARVDSGARGKDRQRPLHARLLEVHPLLQVRGSVWGGCAEYVCHRRRGARLFRTYFHGI